MQLTEKEVNLNRAWAECDINNKLLHKEKQLPGGHVGFFQNSEKTGIMP